jgi:hypothetical protein
MRAAWASAPPVRHVGMAKGLLDVEATGRRPLGVITQRRPCLFCEDSCSRKMVRVGSYLSVIDGTALAPLSRTARRPTRGDVEDG